MHQKTTRAWYPRSMKSLIVVAFGICLFTLPLSTYAESAPSVRIISPNGGETFATTEKSMITVAWEASNVPSGSQICVTDITDTGIVGGLFENRCRPVKNGKGSVSNQISNKFPHFLKPGTHTIRARIQVVKPVLTKTYLGEYVWIDQETTLAEDVSDQIFTILPASKNDKKAGVLEIYEDGIKWEDDDEELVYKAAALESCRIVMGANDGHEFRCVWKGKELATNVPGKKNKLPVKVWMNGLTITKEKTDSEAKANALCLKYANGQPILPYSCVWGSKLLTPNAVGSNNEKTVKEKKIEKKKKTSTKVESSTDQAQAKAAEAIEDAEQEIEEVQKDANRVEDKAMGLAVLAIARAWLSEAKELYEDGKWASAESRARYAEDQAFKAGNYF